MCGRFALHDPVDDLVVRFAIDDVAVDGVPPRWNIAPSQQVLAITAGADGQSRRLETFKWGLVPSWAKDPAIGSRMINARAETAKVKPSFRSAFARRRCLIPVSGFYEWRKPPKGSPRSVRSQPFYIHDRAEEPLALAGLWEQWNDAGDVAWRTCTILTTSPNAVMQPIHDRMPVIIDPEAWQRWLAPGPLSDDDQANLLGPAPDELLTATPVSDLVNRPSNDGPELTDPVNILPFT